MRSIAKSLSLLFLISFLIAACSSINDSPVALRTLPVSKYQVDPTFREIYILYGGREVFGEPISQILEKENQKYQFTTSALWVFDQNAPANSRVRLAPLGSLVVEAEKLLPPPDSPDVYFVDGHIIYEKFIQLYREVGGAAFVGKPLTEVRYNSEHDRYEQFFENLGFFIDRRDGSQPHLLAYGLWLCDDKCRTNTPVNGIIDRTYQVKPPFSQVVENWGRSFTGEPLTEAYQDQEGRLIQVFSNMVLVANPVDPANPDLVSTLPVLQIIGHIPDPLQVALDNPLLYFYPIQGDRGYNIPLVYVGYLESRGGFTTSGPPLNELTRIDDDLWRQCFTSLCLDFEPNAPGTLQIRTAPVGVDYLNLISKPQPTTTPAAGPQNQVTVQIWESFPQVASDQQQEIWVYVMQNNAPLAGIVPGLILTLPDGSQQQFAFPPTGPDGQTHLLLPPIAASNGTLIPYQVCLPTSTNERFCNLDTYLILNNP
jgi:hypothetical protein